MHTTMLTPHFSIAEATVTNTGLPNGPGATELMALLRSALRMELVRATLGNNSIRISSWFRNDAVNRAVGGSIRSQHLSGEAIDFTCPSFGDVREICAALWASYAQLQFDQLICEHRKGSEWVHISFAVSPTRKPRGQVLSLVNSGKYVTGICNPDGTPFVCAKGA